MGDLDRYEENYSSARDFYTQSARLFRKIDHPAGLLNIVETCANLAVATGSPEVAAKLTGCAVARRRTLGSALQLMEQEEFDNAVSESKAKLGESAFQAAQLAGSFLTVDQAIELALGPL